MNFLPESYTLPEDREDLKKAMKADDDNLWIVKVLLEYDL